MTNDGLEDNVQTWSFQKACVLIYFVIISSIMFRKKSLESKRADWLEIVFV